MHHPRSVSQSFGLCCRVWGLGFGISDVGLMGSTAAFFLNLLALFFEFGCPCRI